MAARKRNKWKILFLLLLGLNVIVFISLYMLITTSDTRTQTQNDNGTVEDQNEFTPYMKVQLTEEQLNNILKDHLKDQPYSVKAASGKIQLNATYHVLGQKVEASMDFRPEVTDDGNIILHQNNFSVGNLPLPASEALALVASQAELPTYITVNPSREQVLVELHHIDFGKEYRVKAETFDLQQDHITLWVGK
ncbi:YpmS family protein [Alteribacillus iranensis]|uniref:Uncharacterized protein YpmS n=1 Tax=Alteribacillus iranensis TaxID=930128 RepID=A0A1I1Z410_9BACI|nr:YpmS family protein [Alteribacillus iranensis]SFE26505.1 Uncharacterized protein YpmS [Alteribacillus iranensis]